LQQKDTCEEAAKTLAIVDMIIYPAALTIPSNFHILINRKLLQQYPTGTSAYIEIEDDAEDAVTPLTKMDKSAVEKSENKSGTKSELTFEHSQTRNTQNKLSVDGENTLEVSNKRYKSNMVDSDSSNVVPVNVQISNNDINISFAFSSKTIPSVIAIHSVTNNATTSQVYSNDNVNDKVLNIDVNSDEDEFELPEINIEADPEG
jgi:hypothetical protein